MIEDTHFFAVFHIKIKDFAIGDTMLEEWRQHGTGVLQWYNGSRDPTVDTIKLSCSNLPDVAKLCQQKSP